MTSYFIFPAVNLVSQRSVLRASKYVVTMFVFGFRLTRTHCIFLRQNQTGLSKVLQLRFG